MACDQRLANEKRNIEQVVKALLDAGYEIAVDYDYGDGDRLNYEIDKNRIMSRVQQCDEEYLRVRHMMRGNKSSVYLVYGNADDGSEVVADHGTALSDILDPIMDRWP